MRWIVLAKRIKRVLGMFRELHYRKNTKAHHNRKEKFPLDGCVQFYDDGNWGN
jgi:hypothetical protein